MTDTVKIKLTPNGLSASSATQEDVAKLDFKEDKIESSQDLYVNGDKVITNSDDFKINDDGQVEAKDIKVDDLNVDNKIVAKDLEATSIKVGGNNVIVSSPDLSWDPLTGTLTVKKLKVVENIEVV